MTRTVDARFELLLRAVVPTARKMLAAHGEFYPFAAVLHEGREVELIAADVDEEHPPAAVVLEQLERVLAHRARGGSAGAVALCSDVRVQFAGEPEEVDALRVQLEHAQGAALEVFVPRAGCAGGLAAAPPPRAQRVRPRLFPFGE